MFFIAVAAILYLIITKIGAFGSVLVVMLGFGAVVLVHEFGHFIVAKMAGIKVEAFSIGFSPVLFGILRTEKGFRIRLLPGLLPIEEGSSSDGSLVTFTIPKKGKAGETEYRIGMIPFGGFVKMLGQEDAGPAKETHDPRSFANKSVGARAAVIVAGVTFNAISAVLIFMVAFLIGIRLTPAVVGGVVANSPAAVAGIMAGDEIISIDGKTADLDFSNIGIAAALSDVNQAISLKVIRNGLEKDFSVVAKKIDKGDLRVMGIASPQSLTIAEVFDPNTLLEQTGLAPGDTITSIDGKDVETHWDFTNIVENALTPSVNVLAVKKTAEAKEEFVETKLPLNLQCTAAYDTNSDADLYSICSIVPRMKIAAAAKPQPAKTWFEKILAKVLPQPSEETDANDWFKAGDIIAAAADIENPTYVQLRKLTNDYEGKDLTVKVIRITADGTQQNLSITTKPTKDQSGRVVIGISPVLDDRYPVVAVTIGENKLDIPSGAAITAVNGVPVSDFYGVITEIRKNTGQQISIDYRLNDQPAVAFIAGENGLNLNLKSNFADIIPFDEYKKLYKADGPIQAVVMGCRKTAMFITQSYLTIKSLIAGLVSPKLLMGPVGIITLSYKIVTQQPLIYYVYFLGLINACIAVMNLLPMLPFDGGVLAALLVEKIKGSPLNEKVQGVIAYAGLVLVGAFFIYVTFNDIIRSFFQ